MIVIVVDIQHAVTVGQTLFQVLYVLTYSILKGVLGSSLQLGQGEVKELGQRHSYRVGLGFGPPGLSLPATQCSWFFPSPWRPSFPDSTLLPSWEGLVEKCPHLLPINFICCPCTSPLGPKLWFLREILIGPGEEGPLVQLAWPERSDHVQCQALFTHSSRAGAMDVSREGSGWDVQFKRPCWTVLEVHAPPSDSP